MKYNKFFFSVGLASLAIASCTWAQDGAAPPARAVQDFPEAKLIGKEAPAFSAPGTDGKTHSVASLTEKQPTFLVFWKDPCPHNPRAMQLFNKLAKSYEGKATLMGVVNGSVDTATRFKTDLSSAYNMVADADKSIIKSFDMKKSIVTVMVGKDGKIEKVFPGYGLDAMKQLNEAMAAAAGVPVADVDLTAAPNRLMYG